MSLKVRDSVKLPGDIEAQSTITLAKVSVAGGVDKELVARVARLEVKVTGIDSRLGTVEGETEALQLTSAAHTADILALQEGKQDRLTFDNVPTYGSANPVRSGGVYASIQDVMAVAEGRSKSFTVDFATSGNEFFNSQLSSVTASQFVDVNGNLCNADSLKVGDIILVVELDVPDRWVGAINDGVITFYRMETAKVDLSGYYTKPETDQLLSQKVDNNAMSAYATLATNQDVSGIKNFLNGFQINGTTVHQDESGRIVFHYGNTAKIKIGQLDTLFSNRVTPDQSNTYDLGRSGVYWRDLYLSGTFKDGTNSLSVADIAAKPNAADLETVATNMALAYDETATYAVGDVRIHANELYICNTAIGEPEAWTPAHWTKVNLLDILAGKDYFDFRRISPPTSTTLTNAEIEIFKHGCVIEGSFLSRTNAVYSPAHLSGTRYMGSVVSTDVYGGTTYNTYIIDQNNKISIDFPRLYQGRLGTGVAAVALSADRIDLSSGTGSGRGFNLNAPADFRVNNKYIPAYPTDLSKNYHFSQDVTTGNLSWQEADKPLTPGQVKMILQAGNSAITIPFIGNTTLTSAYINECLTVLTATAKAAITKVIVPVDFTAYESGSITAIQNGFTAMDHLVTCYEAGNIDLDMNGDVVTKIVEIGKTVDEALVYARTWAINNNGATRNGLVISDRDNVIIVPPIDCSHIGMNQYINTYAEGGIANCPNLVYVAHNIVVLKGTGLFARAQCNTPVYNCPNLIYFDFGYIRESSTYPTWVYGGFASNSTELKYLKLNGWDISMNVSASTAYTREALVDLINSLGTPSTTQTLTIGAINLGKLTVDDIAIATAKNWQLQ